MFPKQQVGKWELTDVSDDARFAEWSKDTPGRSRPVLWLEEDAQGRGYILWAKVEPEGETAVIIDNPGVEYQRALRAAHSWMLDNPGWPEEPGDHGYGLGLPGGVR
jgi:hypothetical protein